MIDTLMLMTLSGVALIGWIVGMMRPHRQFWVIFCGPLGLGMLAWYFFLVLSRSQPQLFAGGTETGWPTLAAMVGGVWALLARPRPERQEHTDGGGGAQSA